jgi:hypothetical protein
MKQLLLLACALAFVAAPSAFAQIDPMYEWGGIHVNPTEVTTFNVSLGDSCSTKATVMIEFDDKSGRTVFSKSFDMGSGQTLSLGVGDTDRSSRNGIVVDAFFALPADLHLVIPCITVAFPPGPCKQSELVTLTMEKHDAVTGRSIVFGSNPRATGGTN